ncbi:MAG TPA: hypothetical protein V6D21_06230 [Candidatus Obscuribacterales bacterium]
MSNNQLVSSYSQIYRDLKRTIHYHRNDTYWSCVFFLGMQYSIPVLSALLTTVIAAEGLPENILNTKLPNDALVLIMSIILTVLGTLNSVLKPADSYEWAASFSNKFEEFENELNLSIIELGTRSDVTEFDYIQLLRKTNHNLAKLIDERNLRQVALLGAGATQGVNEPEPVVAEGTE